MVPRYSARPLPATAYVPGVSPRSARPAAAREAAPVIADELATSEELRHGVDLFNHGFPWEAHEAWEPIWFALPRDRPERALMQGLIHAAAAVLKAHHHAASVARDFVASACEYLRRAPNDLLDAHAFAAALEAWSRDVTVAPPTIVLVLGRGRGELAPR